MEAQVLGVQGFALHVPRRASNRMSASGSSAKRKTRKPMKTKHITFQRPEASSVFIAGSFNDWSPNATPLVKNGDGTWALEIALPAGRHEYRFVVDGEWLDDPQAAEVTPNSFGSVNAVLIVE